MGANQFAMLAMKNRDHLAEGEVGCYYCIEMYDASEIKEWTDNEQTAICPKCGIDAIVAKSQHELSKDILEEAHDYWFGKREDENKRSEKSVARDKET